jgi:hypothetical protein
LEDTTTLIGEAVPGPPGLKGGTQTVPQDEKNIEESGTEFYS